MVLAAIGGTLVFISILMFVTVATGTYFANRKSEEATQFPFADAEEAALPTPPMLDHVGRWSTVALVLAVAAYIGPVVNQLQAHAYLAPGMRTW